MATPYGCDEISRRLVAQERYRAAAAANDSHPAKRCLPAKAFVGEHAERVNVCGGRNLAAAELFRRGIARGAESNALAVHNRKRGRHLEASQWRILFGEAQVYDYRRPVGAAHESIFLPGKTLYIFSKTS